MLSTSSSDEDSCAGDQELPPPPELSSPPARRPAAPNPHVPPDVTHTTAAARRGGGLVADRVQCYSQPEDSGTGTGRWKVSAKIQQLLNTLKRPKRRPLPEFYEDDDIELELAANPKDPNAPKPEGGTMTPAVGEQLVVPAGLPRNLEAALQRYGTASFKANVATVLDPNGKLSSSLTYGLPKTSSGDVAAFRGWPSLQWVSTEKLPRPPRDWIPPPRPAEESPAHIEHTSAADGSAMGVIVT
ncbi:Disco-interacting protein, partial [Operophtera brumata]